MKTMKYYWGMFAGLYRISRCNKGRLRSAAELVSNVFAKVKI